MRKTVKVTKVLEITNRILQSNQVSSEEKKGVIALAEELLMDADAYKGFVYVKIDSLHHPTAIGCSWPDEYETKRRYIKTGGID